MSKEVLKVNEWLSVSTVKTPQFTLVYNPTKWNPSVSRNKDRCLFDEGDRVEHSSGKIL